MSHIKTPRDYVYEGVHAREGKINKKRNPRGLLKELMINYSLGGFLGSLRKYFKRNFFDKSDRMLLILVALVIVSKECIGNQLNTCSGEKMQ